MENIICAAGAGAISSAIANPTDVLKVRMQVHGKGTDQMGLIGCFKEIYKYEGVRGLWRGVGPTAQRAVVIASVELPVYDFCKLQLMSAFGDHVANHFMYAHQFHKFSIRNFNYLDVHLQLKLYCQPGECRCLDTH